MKQAILSIISSIVSSDPLFRGVPLTLTVSDRARRLRLRVDPRTGAVLLTVPRRTSRREALAWASTHRDWIERALEAIPIAVPIAPGETIPYRGAPHRIDWRPGRPRRTAIVEARIVTGGPAESIAPRLLRWLKAQALQLLEDETRLFAASAGVMPPKVGIGDPVSRWGSCSSSGSIRYSWRLILAPDFVRRATVAHEVAHLVHMNHSPAFHGLVADLLGEDPRQARRWLRREGAALHRIGRRA